MKPRFLIYWDVRYDDERYIPLNKEAELMYSITYITDTWIIRYWNEVRSRLKFPFI